MTRPRTFLLAILILFSAQLLLVSSSATNASQQSSPETKYNPATRTFTTSEGPNHMTPISAITTAINAGVYGFSGQKNQNLAQDNAVSRHQELQKQQNNGRFSSPFSQNSASARKFNGIVPFSPQAQQLQAAAQPRAVDAQNANARMMAPQTYMPQPQQQHYIQPQQPQQFYVPQQQQAYAAPQQQYQQQPQQFYAPQPQQYQQQYAPQQQQFAPQVQPQQQKTSLMSQLYGTQAVRNTAPQDPVLKASAIISDAEASSFINKLLSGYYLHDQSPPVDGAPSMRDEIYHVATFGGSTFGIIAAIIVALVIGALIVWTSYTLLLCLKPRAKLEEENRAMPLAKQMLLDEDASVYQKI